MSFAGDSHTVLLRSDGQAVACGANDLMSELQRFVLEDSPDPTSQLLHLQQFLQLTINERYSTAPNALSDLDDNATYTISQCVWKLINLCGSGKSALNGPNSVEQLASVCLGELGPVCSHLISFSSNRNKEEEVSTDELARNVKILLLLDAYQVEASKNVVKTARCTLSAVLAGQTLTMAPLLPRVMVRLRVEPYP